MLEYQADLSLQKLEKKFPVCWCTFNGRLEAVSLILFYKLLHCYLETYTQHFP